MAAALFWATVVLGALLFVLALDIMGLFSTNDHFDVDGRVSSTSAVIPSRVLETDRESPHSDCGDYRRLPGHGKRSGKAVGSERSQCGSCCADAEEAR